MDGCVSGKRLITHVRDLMQCYHLFNLWQDIHCTECQEDTPALTYVLGVLHVSHLAFLRSKITTLKQYLKN